MHLSDLKQLGYKCRVRHHRVFEVNEAPIGVLIKDDGETIKEIDNVLTRGEFERAADNYEIYVDSSDGPQCLGRPRYGACVSPRGGFTEVKLKDPMGNISVGKYNFNKKPFNRKNGLRAALGRAYVKKTT